MSISPQLSIVIPLYNAAPFVEAAVQSVVCAAAETEIILVNDGSTDGSGKVARELASTRPNIVLIEQPNRGVSSARNAGIRAARGENIGFLDADDQYAPGALDFLLEELATLRREFGERAMVRGLIRFLAREPAQTHWQLEGSATARTVVTAALQTRVAVETIGAFDEELRGHEDLDWLLRAEEAGIAMPLRKRVVMHYRQHPTSLTRDTTLMDDEKIKMLRKAMIRKRARRVGA